MNKSNVGGKQCCTLNKKSAERVSQIPHVRGDFPRYTSQTPNARHRWCIILYFTVNTKTRAVAWTVLGRRNNEQRVGRQSSAPLESKIVKDSEWTQLSRYPLFRRHCWWRQSSEGCSKHCWIKKCSVTTGEQLAEVIAYMLLCVLDWQQRMPVLNLNRPSYSLALKLPRAVELTWPHCLNQNIWKELKLKNRNNIRTVLAQLAGKEGIMEEMYIKENCRWR